MRPCLVHPGHQQSNPIRPLVVDLGGDLRAVTDLRDDALERNSSPIRHLARHSLALHEVGKDPGVASQTGQCETEVRVEWNYLFLVGGEFFCVSLRKGGGSEVRRKSTVSGFEGGGIYFDGGEDGVSFTAYANDDGALLDCFGGVFDLEDAALGRAWDGMSVASSFH